MEFEQGGGSTKNLQTSPVVTESEDDLFGLGKMSSTTVGSKNGGASNNNSQTLADAKVVEDDLLGLSKKSDPPSPSSLSSSSSASDSSFDENFFLMDESEPRKSNVGPNSLLQLDDDPYFGLKESEKDVPSSTSHALVSSNPPTPRPRTPSGVSVRTSACSSPSNSTKQSPKVQVMERTEEPDPYRIPATVFTRTKSTAPVEWSVASNESLFSIHMGNNSFSRDQIFLLSKSEELGRTEDMFKFPNDANNFSNPATAVANSDKKTPSMEVAEVAAETMKEVIRENAEDRNKSKPFPEGIRRSTSISHHSEGSGASTMSFAFPILTKDGTKGNSVKAETEKQQQQQQSQHQPPSATQNSTGTNWLCCFTCRFCR
ncbi:hypothetical protein IFM89_004600 [Coptis chinensis]|uniref:Uncharacterized protein n=1 Tax=Coptis chinensis TaxID=261450 RepID=A0A835H2T7_9MAGN|nr:hypothetical protein IFM89_004600 [Coptis chinensis]